ncbi:MAG: PKD repeat protein [Granulosicoccus sp.]|jgi:PKD repeat protein
MRTKSINIRTYVKTKIARMIRHVIYGLRLSILTILGLGPISLFAQVTADFTANVTSGCSPLVVSFQNFSSGAGTLSYTWDLGNGNTSTGENPAASYFDPGSYTITLTITNGTESDTESKTAYIEVFTPPTPLTTPSQTLGCYPMDVAFADNSTPGSSPISTWSWDFGDGGTSTFQNPTNSYGLAGTFDVTLLLTDENGCSGNTTFNDLIETNDNTPTAFFSADPTLSCNPPVDVNFANSSFGGTGNLSYSWHFGDGQSSTTSSPTNTYNTAGLYTISLMATDQLGCSDSVAFVDHVNILDNVGVDFTPSSTAICLGEEISFQDISNPTPIFWQWNFGDGTASTSQNPSHTYLAAGTYSVSLTAFYQGSCNDIVVYNNLITVAESPVVAFSPNGTQSCQLPFEVAFNNTSSGSGPFTYNWQFGDGQSSSALENPTHLYTSPGVFDIILTVENAIGCQSQLVQNDLINLTATTADFLPDVFGFCQPLEVNFEDLSSSESNIVDWEWDFGDGGSSTDQNPSYTYQDTGIFDVTLIIENVLGCTDTLTRPSYVFVSVPPLADFDVSANLFCSGTEIDFFDLSTNTTDWFWDFGDDEGTSTLQNPSYSFSDSGHYTITLIALNNGCPDTIIQEDFLYAQPPEVEFNWDYDCENPFSFTFLNNTASLNSWFWDMGDGSPIITDWDAIHTFTSPGQQIVSLTATNDTSGCTETSLDTIYITEPIADFDIVNEQGCQPLLVQFNDLSQDANSYLWDFGDNETSTSANPSHTYTDIGSYSVSLIITDLSGCLDTIILPNAITVTGTVVDFQMTDAVGCDTLAVSFEDLSNPPGTINSWFWEFGDGETSTDQNPVHIYQDPGVFDVQLTIIDSGTCQNTISYSDLAEYIPYPVPSFDVSQSQGCMGDSIFLSNTSTGNAIDYIWTFGNGQSSTDFEPAFTYQTEGYFDITLTAINERGCAADISLDTAVSVIHPIANFNAFPTFAFCPPLLVNISDLSIGNVTEWLWGFGDQSHSTLQYPSHIYNVSGTFDVSLTVWNDVGCSSSLEVTELVQLAGPSGDFTFFPDTAGCPPYDITYVANATGSTQYTWDFGDGYLGLGDSTIHTYEQIGSYSPSLILEDDNGCVFTYQSTDTLSVEPLFVDAGSDETICENDSILLNVIGGNSYSWFPPTGLDNPIASTPIANPIVTTTYYVDVYLGLCHNTDTVTVFVNPAPEVNTSSNEVCFGDSSLFTDMSSVLAPDSLITWSWDFGDNQTSTLANPGIVYSQPDTFTVSLEIETNSGCTAVDSGITIVNPTPIADFTFNDTCLFISTDFVDQTVVDNGSVTNWSWDLGNGSTSTQQNPSLVYLQDTIYYVSLAIVASGGCTDTVTHQVEIYPLPVAEIFVENVCLNEPSLFIDSSTVNTGNIAAWEWALGDGSLSALQDPVHTYDTTGTFAIGLTVTSNHGCQDVTTVATTVYQLPTSQFTLSANSACITPANINLFNNSTGANSFLWDLGNGITETTFNASSSYDTIGSYIIELLVTNQFGCVDSSEDFFVLHPTPTANFTASITEGCSPLLVEFTDLSTNADQIYWDLGNGDFSVHSEPISEYDESGSYTIQFAVEGQGGCTDTLTLTDLITSWPNPVAQFEYDSIISLGLDGTVQFNNLSEGHTTSWWEFGDDNTSEVENPVHQYDFHGSKYVTLGVMDQNGCIDTLHQYIFIEFFGSLSAPNAMAPGDVNEEVRVFLPKGTGLGYYRMMVFDEWGNKLFETTALENGSPSEPWDGTFNGELVPQDVYIWKIDAVFDNGNRWEGKEYTPKEFNRTGTVTLLR